jgi:hypothetical protein
MTRSDVPQDAARPRSPAPPRNLARRQGLWLSLGILGGLALILGLTIRRTRDVSELPDVGDPVDLYALAQPVLIADDENAYVRYNEAHAKLGKATRGVLTALQNTPAWSRSGPDLKVFLKQNRPALLLWREGTDRPDALYHQTAQTALDTLLPLAQDISLLGRLAGLEGSRHEEVNEMAEAWRWNRAILRASRHVGKRGVIIERMIGASLHEQATRRILPWSANPRVDSALLRQALADTIAADTMTPPLSQNLKYSYLIFLRDLNELRVLVDDIPLPGGTLGKWVEQRLPLRLRRGIKRTRLSLSNDDERSRRLLRLLLANWLPQVDRPESERAPVAIAGPTPIFAADPAAPVAAQVLPPHDLDLLLNESLLANSIFRPGSQQNYGQFQMSIWEKDGPLARERRRRAALIIRLAAEVYKRERGRSPANAGELMGPYLKALPEGYAPDEPIPGDAETLQATRPASP